ncbi:RNA methyltransferase [Sutterella sp.]|uniref:TrmH family RNA methyltransferase n=1 Tax=Sutterella sp. TaxID=1981025 RepID=UPI0026DFF7F5|nr:RNA methyltransferase [Sutterella sp.]MDO5531189.1 RNA methyltransferase [Sutterella sp.]
MSHLYIESDANPRVKRWKKLATELRAVRREGAALLEGIHLLQTVAEHPEVRVHAVMLCSGAVTEEAVDLAETVSAERKAPAFLLADRIYSQISPVENGVGVMCEIEIPVPASEDDWAWEDALYLDGVQDAGNVGTMIRTAAASGVKAVIAGPGTAGFWTPRVLRAAMGAHFSVHLIEGMNLRKFREAYRGRLLAADARGGSNLFEAPDYTSAGPVCWMMGAEGPGLSADALAVSDERYWIPISPGVESLNVGAAAAVCLFDSSRRRALRKGTSPAAE